MQAYSKNNYSKAFNNWLELDTEYKECHNYTHCLLRSRERSITGENSHSIIPILDTWMLLFKTIFDKHTAICNSTMAHTAVSYYNERYVRHAPMTHGIKGTHVRGLKGSFRKFYIEKIFNFLVSLK